MIYLYLFGTCFHFIYVFIIIGKNKEEFSLIESIGIANLSSDQLKYIVEKYFITRKYNRRLR